jgi:DNA polymerase-3 subunit beta
MKLSCLQSNLSKGLSIVGRAVATRSTLPITQNVLIQTDGQRLKLAATNLEIAITCWVGARIEEEGAITIPARLLTEFINSLPNERVDMALSQRTLHLQCLRSEARINGLDAQDFPPIPVVTDGIFTKIDAELLKEAIGQVTFAAATEESRPVLTGVHMDFNDDRLTMAAADGFRLGVHYTSLSEPVKDRNAVIVPARALNELNRFLGDEEEQVEITVNQQKTQIMFKLKDINMVSQLIQGNFPNYAQLIPQSYVTRAVVDKAEFAQAIRRASIFARDGSGIIRLEISTGEGTAPGRMKISSRAEEVGDNVNEIDARVDGEPTRIAFNARYLSDVLGVIEEKQVALETTTSSSPGVIRPVGSEKYVHVIMPMFVQW